MCWHYKIILIEFVSGFIMTVCRRKRALMHIHHHITRTSQSNCIWKIIPKPKSDSKKDFKCEVRHATLHDLENCIFMTNSTSFHRNRLMSILNQLCFEYCAFAFTYNDSNSCTCGICLSDLRKRNIFVCFFFFCLCVTKSGA